MPLFSDTTEAKKEKAPKKASVAKKALSVKESGLAARLLSRPRITEKSYALGALNQYVFVVVKEATKKTVARAVEEAYGVSVTKVRMVRLPEKRRVFGKSVGSKGAIKKAIVSVEKGQTLELFKGGM